MIIDCIADLHGHYPQLDGGDLLIVAGDLTTRDAGCEYIEFCLWLAIQPYKMRIVIGGNHDSMLEKEPTILKESDSSTPCLPWIYLCDSGAEFEGLKIWGSPWSLTFPGINPHCTAFTGTEEDLEAKFKLIPDDTDILITHGPPYGILDRMVDGRHVGIKSLQMELFRRLRLKLIVCGHIHESYGIEPPGGIVERAVNCSHVNERYEPVNKPIRIKL